MNTSKDKNNGNNTHSYNFNYFSDEFSVILDSSQDGIHVTDGDGVTILFNKACERIDNIKREDIIGRNMREMVEQGYFSESVSLKALKEKKSISMIQNVRGKEVIATATPIFKDGKISRIVVNSRDVTELNELRRQLENVNTANEEYRVLISQLESEKLSGFIANSIQMKKILELAIRVANVSSTILIQGESGVGKGVISKLIHHNSDRSEKALLKIDCGAIPEKLLESELFGYEKGSFTGANTEGKVGLIELADQGTLFLDEIGELPLQLQSKLLRVLQDREFMRIGGKETISVDIRITAATNKDLKQMVEDKTFRSDLFYRLNVIPIYIPPLRERREDIIPLINNIIEKVNQKYKMNKQFKSETLKKLLNYDWPGNVRELENIVERLVVISSGDYIGTKELPAYINVSNIDLDFIDNADKSYKEYFDIFEKTLLENVKKQSNTTNEMSKILKIDSSTIRRKFKKHGIKFDF